MSLGDAQAARIWPPIWIRGWATLVVGLLMVATALARDEDLARVAAEPLARAELVKLAQAADLVDATGRPLGPALQVELLGGTTEWIDGAVDQAIAAATPPVFRRGEGPHRLEVQFELQPGACALGLALQRRGWVVRAPTPTRRRLRPALAAWPLALGVLWLLWRRRQSGAVAISAALTGVALVAQGLVTGWPWPGDFGSISWSQDLLEGPAVSSLLRAVRSMGDVGVSVAWGVVALGLMLALFDHRRHRGHNGPSLWAGLLGVGGVMLWTEAGWRAGLGLWLGTGIGRAWLVTAALAAVPAWWIRGRQTAKGHP